MSSLPMARAPQAPPSTEDRVPGRDAQRFVVDGMDCASCAQTVRKVVAGLEGAGAVQVSFGNATLLVDGPVSPDAIAAAVTRAGYTAHAAGAPRAPLAPFWRRNRRTVSTTVSVGLLVLAVLASLTGVSDTLATTLYLSSMALGGWPIALAAGQALRRRVLDMNVLMAMAAIGAVAIGDFAEGAWVLVLFAVGTTLETFALERSRRSVEQLMDLAPAEAHLLDDALVERTVPVELVAVGDRVLVRPGERLPLDGVIAEGRSSIDESALTGESVPVDKQPGDQVFAGTLNTQGALTVGVSAASGDSTLARIAQLVSDAQGSQAPSERFVDRFARLYTPLVFAAAILLAAVGTLASGDADTWVYRALALLIVACPCALVISIPVSVVSAIGGAARRGVLIKGGQTLEELARIRAIAVDKTGTLTRGRPELTGVTVLGELTDSEALSMMAAIERGSEHPLAAAIRRAAEQENLPPRAVTEFEALPGRGARARLDGRLLWAGGPRMAAEQHATLPAQLDQLEQLGQTAVLLGDGDRVLAIFGLADQLRPEAPGAVARLHADGIAAVVMLTGDSPRVAQAVAERAGVADWRAGLLPEDKLVAVRELTERHGPVAMVGDGVNDAPALAAASVGVAMGAAGSDIALEAADVALMGDELDRLPEALAHSRRALQIMRQNVIVSLATKAIFVVLAPLGLVTLVLAVAVDMGVSLLVTLNGLRLLRTPRSATTAVTAAPIAPPAPAPASPCAGGSCCAGETASTR